MMRRTASAICLARTVCCSNLVFTADWEMHSWDRQEVLRKATSKSTRLVTAREAQNRQIPESKDLPQTSSQNSETRASSLESLLQEHPLGELYNISP